MKMSNTPKVTVLMPVYNGVPFVAEAIQSILGQTFTDFEFLIIDDGSTDESISMISAYNDLRIRFVKNASNLGLVASLNHGLELARGEYIARMDADDISRPERLACQVEFMDANRKIGVCGSWVQFFPKAKNKIWKLPQCSEEIKSWQFHAVGIAHPSAMMRRQYFVENGLFYDPQYLYVEDYELWGRALKYMEFANIQKVLLDYRISSGQICSVYRAEQASSLALLRLIRVRELGIEPTSEEQQLHEIIMNNSMYLAPTLLDEAEQWLQHLISKNVVSGVYQKDLFSRRLLDIWFSICTSLEEVSACSLWRCLMTPLWLSANNPIRCWVRALGAWILRKIL